MPLRFTDGIITTTCNLACPLTFARTHARTQASKPSLRFAFIATVQRIFSRHSNAFVASCPFASILAFAKPRLTRCAFDALTATMSAPTGEASTPAVPAVPAPQPQGTPAPAVVQSAPAPSSAAPQQPGVSGGNVTHMQHTVPVAQSVAQGQRGQAPPTGAPGGPGASVPRAPAVITRDTFAVRSLGPAVTSLVKKVCEAPPPSFKTRNLVASRSQFLTSVTPQRRLSCPAATPRTTALAMNPHACLGDFDFTVYSAIDDAPNALPFEDNAHCLTDTVLMCLQSRVLMVGAGGIGCELLKNLVLLGFGEIHVVDLDTIDLSNLNRQFLFKHEHIKKSKALVAKETATRFNPKARIEAHHANIKETQFNVDWFRGFDIVFNALDNMEARRHVNKMCLAADVPLIESGTTGFNGQVQVIKKGVTACYDCSPKDAPKSFPVCTIRSTPSQPIHCIVWGKSYLLKCVYSVSAPMFLY